MKGLRVPMALAAPLLVAAAAVADQSPGDAAGGKVQPAAMQRLSVQTERWYSPGDVARGAEVYAGHCASCHGAQADGNRAGDREVPALDGSGHSSHHGLEQMLEQVANGTLRIGGTMPPFGAVLDEGDRRAVIAWIQSHWPDDVYRKWNDQFGASHAH